MKKLIFNIVALLLLGSSVAVAVDIFPPGPGLRFFEQAGNGQNYKAFAPPAAITSNTTCTFENDSNFIPDSCVGNGVDDTGALADSDYGDITVSGVGTVWTVDPDAVALGTDTTGNYVATVADGTGIDGTCSAEGCTYTPTLDLTEITAAVLGNGTTSALQLGTIELGAATDTTISRPGAGDIAVEGNTVVRAGSAAGGDLTGTYPSPTVAANAVALGTDTTGGYAASASEGGPATTVADTDFGDISITAGVWSVDPNSVALTTDTTGNYAAGDAEAGAALTGDSATAFFSSGTIEDARIDGSAEVDEVLNSDLGDFTCVAGSCAIDANAVALTTDTTGNYMADIAAGVGIATTHTPAEGSTGTIAFDFSDAGADPALAADTCRFTGDATTNGEIVCEGDTANAFETRIVIADPTADRAMTIPNADSNPIQPLTCGSTDKVSAIAATGAITCTADVSGGSLADADYGDIVVSGSGTVWTVDSNSVALTTDTTGNYAAGDAEAGNALTGDSATAFFSAGALEVARGGNGAAPGADDQAMISDSSSAGTFRTLTDSDGTNKALQYDQATNTFSAMQVQESMCLALGDETTAITTGTKIVWTMPYAFTLTSVTFSVTTQSTSGLPTLNVLEDTDAEGGGAAATTIFSTKPTIDANERRSSTAATASVLSDSSLAANSEMSAAIDVAGTGTKGPKLCLIGHQ